MTEEEKGNQEMSARQALIEMSASRKKDQQKEKTFS